MEQHEIDKAYADMEAYINEIISHNEQILKQLGIEAQNDFSELIDGCNVTEKIKFVDAPKGRDNTEDCGVFKNIHVDQWSVGMGGDSFAGFIYANINGKWIEVPYEC